MDRRMCMRDRIPIEDFPSPKNRIAPATLTVCDRYGLVKLTGENEDKSRQKKTHGGKRMKRPKVAHKNKLMCVNVFILSPMIIYMYSMYVPEGRISDRSLSCRCLAGNPVTPGSVRRTRRPTIKEDERGEKKGGMESEGKQGRR